jgi:hypothetical protein
MKLLDQSPDLIIKIVRDRILYKQKVQDNVCDQPFFEMLIFNKEQAVREMCEKILTKATDRLFKLIE